MLPLLGHGERIIVNKFVYRFQPVRRGDIVVFWYPRDPSVSFIKRVVGIPGDVVEISRGRLYVNDRAVDEKYVAPRYRDRKSFLPHKVAKGHFYVLGDHRSHSNDSRTWGDVPEKYIYGRAVFRFWPLSKMGFVQN
jgi:signal peptidase I